MKTIRIVKNLFMGYEVTLAALASRILSVLDAKLSDAPLITAQKTKASAELDLLNKAIGRVRKSAFTEKIASKDTDRDTLYQAFIRRIDSDRLRIDDPVIAANAESLYKAIEENGRSMARGYLDQTNQLENLFEKLSAPRLSTLIVDNGIQGLYDALVNAQSEFRDIWTESVENESSKETILPLREAANALLDTLNGSLFKRLDIGAEDTGEPYTSAIAMIATAVSQTETVQRARISRNDTTDDPVTEAAAS